jgi:spoIIIJ-associated protein
MSEKRASLEVIAPSVEEAVAKGLTDLGMTEEAVEIEVLDPGSRGLFGLGSRQARIRLTIKASTSTDSAPSKPKPVPIEIAQSDSSEVSSSQQTSTPLNPPGAGVFEETEEAEEAETYEEAEEEEKAQQERSIQDDITLHVARETVIELLEKMKVHADVTAHYGEADDTRSRIPIKVDITGNDLSILIGPRAETLNALQYISALIVGKELGRSVPLVVDVEGYRARREQQIRQLARRMADQAIKTGRRQVLEPMPANERRLVHIELRSDPSVTTQSVGEEPRRKVTIIPEK